MNLSGRHILRAALLGLVVIVAVEGTLTMVHWRGVPLILAERDDTLRIRQVVPRAGDRQLQAGDALLTIRGEKVTRLAEAAWKFGELLPGEAVAVTAVRGDSVFSAQVAANKSLPVVYMFLDRLTGFAFIALAFLVGWRGPHNLQVRSFFRVNLVAGLSVLLLRTESPYAEHWLRSLHAIMFLVTYSLVPAFLADFVFVYTHAHVESSRLKRIRWLIFAPFVALALASPFLYEMAIGTSKFVWINRLDLVHRQVFTVLLSLTVLVVATWMVRSYLAAEKGWDRTRYRWLLLCMLAGVCPYVFLEKFPTLLGANPLLLPGLSMSLLLIAPLGWGMAVASFHMLEVEWTLSRTVVYFAAAGIVLYVGMTITTAVASWAEEGSRAPVVIFWLLGLAVAALAALALVAPLQRAVDRLYYGDWFDARQAVRTISFELASALQRPQLESIFADRLPKILQLNACQLLTRDRALPSPLDSNPQWWQETLPANDLIVFSAERQVQSKGFHAALPLIHAGNTYGCLLLGAKASGAPYSYRDRELLRSLSSVGGMALANMELNERLLDQECRSAVSELAGGIAHEIKNALAPVLGRAQLIERMLAQSQVPGSMDTLQESTQVIASMCQRIRRIADNLNDLTKPLSVQVRSVRLQSVADNALSILDETAGRIRRFRSLEPDAAFQLRRMYDSAEPPVHADPELLLQVFLNLIINACDAMDARPCGTLTVGTQWRPESDSVAGFVEDTGVGIPAERLDRIFLPYVTTKQGGKGTGLGLAVVRTIIEAHRGTISVSSTPGQGTRFVFSLPRGEAVNGSVGP